MIYIRADISDNNRHQRQNPPADIRSRSHLNARNMTKNKELIARLAADCMRDA
jgi:hypothetical protein